ncbi:hypothetical protein DYBT9623_05200 [Dyadobacter sp. CECT 9623]|uniref:Uncharacterized protein n=1 Tax=Dyadobacter linearis TaxID=2823330 RepID=A0ABM8UXX0_9BACT|nr:hypothetical protein DYBT9623_05200 [Dyadobacter sp. CECT 9623]
MGMCQDWPCKKEHCWDQQVKEEIGGARSCRNENWFGGAFAQVYSGQFDWEIKLKAPNW